MSLNLVRITAAPVPVSATQHLIPMRDGVRLATDVYLPADASPTATVLVRLPYDKDSRYVFFEAAARRFTNRGYAVVVQDVRGKFRSEGPTLAFVFEAPDGYDTIEWIVAQPWSNGVVGMFGDSYYGFTQWAAVSSAHPALKAIVPRVTTADLAGAPPQDGPVGEVEWLTTADYLCRNWLDHDRYELDLDWRIRPIRDIVESAYQELGRRSATLDFVIPESETDDDGSAVSIYGDRHPFGGPAIPVLHTVGWFDNLAIASMRDFIALRGKPAWSEVQYLTADSVDHENYFLAHAPITEDNDHDINDEALERLLDSYTGPALEFFDVFLQGSQSPDTLPRVRWHLGHEGYHESPSWPPPGACQRNLYLTALGDARDAGGRLVPDPPSDTQTIEWVHDPEQLVPSAVVDSFSFLHDYPDEAATARRADVVSFTAAAADESLDLAGPVDLWIAVTSTGPSTDLFAKLLDLAPDGTAHMIVRGQGHLTAVDHPKLVRIELGHTGYRLRPGHRLRLHLASSDYPEFLPNPGTTENRWLATDTRTTTQRLTTDLQTRPYLSITTLEADRAGNR